MLTIRKKSRFKINHCVEAVNFEVVNTQDELVQEFELIVSEGAEVPEEDVVDAGKSFVQAEGVEYEG